MDPVNTTPELETLLKFLKHERNCDLTGYRRSTLLRRFRYRMKSLLIHTFPNYLEYLRWHPEEMTFLLDEVPINFTCFFRDDKTWNYLAAEVIPRIVARKNADEPIRVWSAGCATGEEIYSLSILLAEALGIESCCRRVRGYATDRDRMALSKARAGVYGERDIASVPKDLLARYFEPTERGYRVDERLRRTIVFGHHDLIGDAPLPRIDLLLCRNTLIYFNPEIQRSIFVRFHFALNRTGFLFLGKSELFTRYGGIFLPLDLEHRVYVKGRALELEDLLAVVPKPRPGRRFTPSLPENSLGPDPVAPVPVARPT